MQLPKYKKKKRLKLKVCQEPGCGKEYWGHVISKYCELHHDMKNRVRVRREYKPVDEDNMVFNHSLQDVTEYTFCCSLEGCNKMYSVSLYPKQSVYPRYCEEHRNPFKRKNFLREKKKWMV